MKVCFQIAECSLFSAKIATKEETYRTQISKKRV